MLNEGSCVGVVVFCDTSLGNKHFNNEVTVAAQTDFEATVTIYATSSFSTVQSVQGSTDCLLQR